MNTLFWVLLCLSVAVHVGGWILDDGRWIAVSLCIAAVALGLSIGGQA